MESELNSIYENKVWTLIDLPEGVKPICCKLVYKKRLIWMGGNELRVQGYANASFQSDKDDNKFQSRYIFTLRGGAVSWKSFKEEMTTDSTTEVEYIAASEAVKEVV
ncbi:CCHC-type domain-containing protein [Abeliophyllum distichum]|uniref:CCHC-type domain-containing protein n=1 Tax=Abeliophyllum distichum TaxID=126358 RepID=A0ABD1QF28_9LAMI